MLLVILGRIFWRKLKGLWAKAVQGGAILADRREYALRVALPSFGAWLAKLGVIAVFLAGYGITVTFHTVMSVMGGNSIANTVSVTPGGVGVNQATNVAALNDVTDAATATAYSLGQQLAITAWNIAFAVVLVVWAFGWTGGKLLVEQSYTDAKVKVDEQKAQRARDQGDQARRARGAALARDQDGLPPKASCHGVVVGRCQLGERPALGHVDDELAGVDEADEVREHRGVAADADLFDAHAAAGIAGPGRRRAREDAAIGDEVDERGGVLRALPHELEDDVEALARDRLAERHLGVVDDPIRAGGVHAVAAARARRGRHWAPARLASWTAAPPTPPPAPLMRMR